MIKDRNGKDLTDVEVIKKMWQEYTEELHKTGLNDPDIHNDMVTHLKPDILVSEVKWGLESCTTNHANGGDRIPAEPFQTPHPLSLGNHSTVLYVCAPVSVS